MANPFVTADIRDFYFYFKYLWAPADFENMQAWLRGSIEGLAEGAFGGAGLSGLNVVPATGLTVDVDSGLGVSPQGRLLVLAAPGSATFASPSGNPAWSLLVLRPTLTNVNFIPEPVNPSNPVPLHQQFGASLVVINGTPSPTPSYPATQSGDIVLMGVKLAASQSSIAITDFDRFPVSTRRKQIAAVQILAANYNVQAADEHLEFDCSGGARMALLPSAELVPGQKFTLIKTDSSANALSVSGTDGMSGQNLVTLDAQWQTMTVRSNGFSYRVI
jgi:hypothetical protein